jgi:hypothetical protein
MKQLFCTALALASLSFASLAFAADKRMGQITLAEPIPVGTLLDKPASYVDQVVQVKGKITEVCEAMGCWMSLTDDAGRLLRVDVGDHGEIVFPLDSVGKTAIAEGKLRKTVMSREQVVAMAREEAAEAHRKFNASKIKSGKTIYQIEGTGAVILE